MKNSDEKLLNKYSIPDNSNLNDYSMQPIYPNSLIIKNGVMYIIGAMSSGKSTLLAKMSALYKQSIDPIVVMFYAGLSADETTTFALNSFKVHPMYVKLPTPESMVSFFQQYRYKRIKLAELLMFLLSVYRDDATKLLVSVQVVNDLGLDSSDIRALDSSTNKRFKALLAHITALLASKQINVNAQTTFIYLSEFIIKNYSQKHKINFNSDPIGFIARCLISFSKGFKETTITVDLLNEPGIRLKAVKNANVLSRFVPYTFPAFVRVANTTARAKTKLKVKLELVPSICIFDDVAQYPLLTTEHAGQFVKDLFAESRRFQNTFIVAAQRYNLLNKTLRSLTHTFFIGYGLIDSDLPIIAKEIPSNLLDSKEFLALYKKVIKPFTWFVYNNKLGYNVLTMKR